MNYQNVPEYLIDPLGDISRRVKRNLLVVSVLGFLTSFANFIPEKISVLGIETSRVNQIAYIWILTAILAYFIIAFIILGLHDYACWKLKYENYKLKAEISSESWTRDNQAEYDMNREIYMGVEGVTRNAPRVMWLRICFEFYLPIVIAFASAVSLVRSVIFLK